MRLIGGFIRLEQWPGYVAPVVVALCVAIPVWGAPIKQSLELARGEGHASTSPWSPAARGTLAAYLKQTTGKIKATKPSVDGTQLQTWVEPETGIVVWAFACEQAGNRRMVQIEHALRAFSAKQGDEEKIYAYVRSQCAATAASNAASRPGFTISRVGADELIKPEHLEDVLYTWRLTYAGTLMQFKETIYVLLTDGTGLKNPVSALSEIDRSSHQNKHPKRWFRWRKVDTGYQVRSLQGGKWAGIKSDEPPKSVRPVASGTRYSGELSGVTSAGSLGSTHSANWRYFTLSPDGRYERKASSLRGSDSTHSDSVSGTYASTCDKDGRSSAGTSNTGGVSVGTRSSKARCGAALAGRYEIDGYRITLQGDDGHTEQLSFFEITNTVHKSDASKRKYSLMIGGAGYGMRDR